MKTSPSMSTNFHCANEVSSFTVILSEKHIYFDDKKIKQIILCYLELKYTYIEICVLWFQVFTLNKFGLKTVTLWKFKQRTSICITYL